MKYILYNGLAGDGNRDRAEQELSDMGYKVSDEVILTDIREIKSYEEFFANVNPNDTVILCGGDGTLNRFANESSGIDYKTDILYFPCGTGNDFAADTGHERECEPFSVTQSLRSLPSVELNGKSYKFINGVGYGIDGYCCEVGDKLKATGEKKVNYTAIAIKGLLFHYKPRNAVITVDGIKHTYKKVWLAPTMNGRYYGGGMIPTPEQSRDSKDNKLSVMVYHNSGKLKALAVFPSIFKGEHVKHQEMVQVLSGSEITVEFDKPTALQIDGETHLGITSYKARSADFQRQL